MNYLNTEFLYTQIQESNFSRKHIEDETGITRMDISRLKSGEAVISNPFLRKLAKLSDVLDFSFIDIYNPDLFDLSAEYDIKKENKE